MKQLILNNIQNILIIRKHNQIGDLIVSAPMYYALKKKFPNSKITLLASKTNYPIPFKEIIPYLDDVIIFDKTSLKTQVSLILKLRKKKFDIAIIPSTVKLSNTSNLIGFLTGSKFRVGVRSIDNKKNRLSFLLNIKKDFNWKMEGKHQIFRNLDIVRLIGCELKISEIFSCFRDLFFVDEVEEINYSNHNPDKSKLLIGIHPGAGKQENIWNTSNFVELIEYLSNQFPVNFLITAGLTDEIIIGELKKNLESKKIPYTIAFNLPYRKLLTLISYCDLFISNDTGVMHIAGLTEVILISLIRKNNVSEWVPIGKNKFYVASPSDNINDLSVIEVKSLCNKILRIIMYEKKLI